MRPAPKALRFKEGFGINGPKSEHTEAIERRGPMAHIQSEAGETCPSCGGSGVLRTDSAGYRTCLECVGQGVQPDCQRQPLAASPAALSQWLKRSSRKGVRNDLSAWISGAR
jgi:hypothetical protein